MNSGFFFLLFSFFLGGRIFTTWLQKTIHCNSNKLSLWKKCAKTVRFQWQDFWNCHSQTIGSSRLPKYSRILKIFYFPLWSVSKFNLAKNSSCGWSSMWLHHRIEKKTPISLNCFLKAWPSLNCFMKLWPFSLLSTFHIPRQAEKSFNLIKERTPKLLWWIPNTSRLFVIISKNTLSTIQDTDFEVFLLWENLQFTLKNTLNLFEPCAPRESNSRHENIHQMYHKHSSIINTRFFQISGLM